MFACTLSVLIVFTRQNFPLLFWEAHILVVNNSYDFDFPPSLRLITVVVVFRNIHPHTHTCSLALTPPALSIHTDTVTGSDVQRVGQRLMESSPAFAALGDLSEVPSRTDLETALFKNKGVLRSKRKLFTFGQS